jgi:hypothetical protein
VRLAESGDAKSMSEGVAGHFLVCQFDSGQWAVRPRWMGQVCSLRNFGNR